MKHHRKIPRSWNSVRVPLPKGEAIESYADDIETCLTVRGFRREWAWSRPADGSANIVLATARLTSLPILLACVAGINRLAETPAKISRVA